MATKKTKLYKGLKGKLLLWLAAYLDESNPNTFFNQTGAARAARYKYSTEGGLRAVGAQNYAKLRERIEAWLDEHGLSEARLKKKLFSLTEAKETKFFAHQGKIEDTAEVESLGIQIKALDMALKVKGMYAPEKVEHSGLDKLAERLDRARQRGTKGDS